MKRIVILVGLSLSGLVLLACEPAGDRDSAPSALEVAERIDARNVRSHIEFLADDLLEGRYTGERGYEIAAKYVATQYKLLGLEPAGENGSYFQQVSFRTAIPVDASATLTVDGKSRELDIPDDLAISGSFAATEEEATGDLVFVGYGFSAPEFGYDDFENVDVDGKIAVMMRFGTPSSVPDEAIERFGGTTTRTRNAVERGAVGVIYIYRPDFVERWTWPEVAASVADGDLDWVGPDGKASGDYEGLKLLARASYDFGAELLEMSGREMDDILKRLEDGESVTFDIPARLETTRMTEWEDFTAPNVAAVLPGSDSDRKGEYVLYSGHLDAVGMNDDDDAEDKVNNGAYDNATGIGIMLEVARVFSEMEQRPDRSILFLAVTGEEQGLFGSEYWAANPTVDIDKVSANVNLDMPVLTFPLADVIAYGAEHSEMEAIVRKQAETQNLALSDDPWPEQQIFKRSDQYSFVRKGVPAVFLVPGWTSLDPDVNGEEMMRSFEEEHYHQGSDDLARPFDMDSAERFAAANFLIGLEIANRNRMVGWLKGDYFGEKYGNRFSGE